MKHLVKVNDLFFFKFPFETLQSLLHFYSLSLLIITIKTKLRLQNCRTCNCSGQVLLKEIIEFPDFKVSAVSGCNTFTTEYL